MKSANYRDGRAWDLAAALPLVGLCVLAASGFAIMICREWPSRHDGATLLVLVSQLCSTAFLLFQAALLLVRRLPVARAAGLPPRAWALLGANFAFLLLLFPKSVPTPFLASTSGLLMIIGTVGSILTLLWLGKSFAIFPQARTLVTHGPYRFVRHPLYFAEQVSAFGLALQYRQPWGLMIVSIGLLLQLPRMHYEERVLEESYLPYKNYKKRTARLIPFVY